MVSTKEPTERELQILKVLWEHGEATVRAVHEALPAELGIVQNTVQAFLRLMEQKGLVTHRTVGRSFVYRAAVQAERTKKHLLSSLLDGAFDGALDQLVASALSVRPPSEDELTRLRELLASAARTRRKP